MKKRILSLTMALMVVLSLCANLTVLADDNTVVVDGVTFSKNMKILVKYPLDKTDESYTIPDSVTIIGNSAFCPGTNIIPWNQGNKYLKNITIPNSVTSIEDGAFSNCANIEKLVIPDSVTHIGDFAFSSCPNLKSVVLSQNIDKIPGGLFFECSNLKNVTIPDEITTIGSEAFTRCTSLESITIPDSVMEMHNAFSGCSSLKNVVISNNIDFLYGFEECTSLEHIVIPGGVSTIGYQAFFKCTSLMSVTLNDGVNEMGDMAFAKCTKLKEVIIPKSMTEIGKNNFGECTSLTNVYYDGTEVEWNSINIDAGNGFLQTANIHFTEPSSDEIRVTLYGKKLSFDQPPVIENGRTLVPLRAIFEALDAEVAWDDETRTVRAIRYGTYVELQIGSNEMKVNSEIKTLDVPAMIVGGRTMVPARAIAEAFGCTVGWDGENRVVTIE